MAILQGSKFAEVEAWVSDKNGVIADLANYQSSPIWLNSVFDVEDNIIPLNGGKTYYPQGEVTFQLYIDIIATPYDDIYNRFYFVPVDLNFGAITSEVNEKIWVWNANILPSQINTYQVTGYNEGDGVSDTLADSFFPMQFYDQEVKHFEFNVSALGNPNFNYTINLGTSLGETDLIVSGYRSVLFSLSPHREFVHKYKFSTRVTESFSGEQRALLSEKAFETFEYEARADERMRAFYRQLFNSGTLIRFTVPVWEDYVYIEQAYAGEEVLTFELGELESRSFYVGDSVLIWSDHRSYEQIKIDDIDYDTGTLTLNTPIKQSRSNFYATPLRSGIAEDDIESNFNGINSHILNCQFQMTERKEPFFPESNLTLCQGKPILLEPNYTKSGKETFGYQRDEFEGIGSDKQTWVNRGLSKELSSYTWKCFNREHFDTLRHFIYTIKGRFKSFYLPRFGREFILDEATNLDDRTFSIRLDNYRYNIDEFENKALFLQDKKGNKYYGKINNTLFANGVFTLNCDNAIKFTVEHDDLIHLCLCDLVRSVKDEFEVKFEDVNDAECKFSVVRVKE